MNDFSMALLALVAFATHMFIILQVAGMVCIQKTFELLVVVVFHVVVVVIVVVAVVFLLVLSLISKKDWIELLLFEK